MSYMLNHMLDHVLDYMIIDFVTKTLQLPFSWA